MEFPYTVDSQAAFDELVKDRLGRERAKFADYDELKTKVAEADTKIAAAEQATAEAVSRAEAAEGKVATFEGKQQVADWAKEIVKDSVVPASALRGSTREELEAHFAELKPLLTAQSAPVIPNQGDQPDKTAVGNADERAAVQALFGSGGD
ncbi:hypothetical protein [Cellulomonas hominis]|uniref:hypothetical protein n=1 Tax=Cellulomonas hominis TaxID=156981 RepID=UPI0014448118|nr:hypothetical protein [Cellulomonas hominis]NKY08937.1 hypothetical protein [Cellulomonas hominis]